MTEPTNIVPDPLDGLLLPPPPCDGEESLRRRLLEQTTRALRRRRRWRVVAWAAALAACFVGGALTVYGFGPRQVERVVVIQKPPESPPPAPVAPAAAAPASAVALEWKAFDADKPRPDLYRRAGEQYVRDDDPASALRCYGQSLNGASDKDLAISPDDDYLLMMVKEARLKEKAHAKNGD